MSDIKYSIIVPHKNSFELLLILLKSIPKRNDFEVIIVDDNSCDVDKRRLKEYSFNNNVFLVFNKKSEGAGKARNIGLNHVKGKWIVFADADDFFTDKIEVLFDNYYNVHQDVVYFGTSSSFVDTGLEAFRHVRYLQLVEEFAYDKSKENDLRFYFTPPWAKMIKHECIINHGLLFEEILASNDIAFSLKLGNLASSIIATPEILYNITVTHGSLTNTFIKEYFDSKFNSALRANDYLRSIDKSEYQQSILYFFLKSYKFGFCYFCSTIAKLISHRSNVFIGLEKIFSFRKVLKEREQLKYMKSS